MRQQFNLKSYLPFESTANITDKNLKGRMSAFISYKKKDKKSEEPVAIFECG